MTMTLLAMTIVGYLGAKQHAADWEAAEARRDEEGM